MKRYIAAVLLLIGIILLPGCGARSGAEAPGGETGQAAPVEEAPVEETPAEEAPADDVLEEEPPAEPVDPVEERLEAMTAEQLCAQLLVAGIEGTAPGEDARRAVQEAQVGGVILFARNVESAGQLAELTNALKELNGDYIPLFLGVDQEGGAVNRMPPEVENLPPMLKLGQTGDAGLCRAAGELLGAQCAAFGFNLDFAPVLDVWSNPENKVIGNRSLGTDGEIVAQLGTALMEGIRSQGVIPAVKHFPGHGDTAVDSHVGLPVVDKTLEGLEALELIPFRAAIEAGADMVMVGHILMTELDPERPASLSPAVVDGLLRQELGFDGAVCTDDLTMGAITKTYGVGEAAVLAVEAGCDVLLVCHNQAWEQALEALTEAADSGRLSRARLEDSVRRILKLKEACGLTGQPVPEPDTAALNEALYALDKQQ